ncbi:probable tubulin polyglutamylase TTLL9 isoform X2 [Biomphalaria glabrata]|uniref:Tubulin--tyrosine ligase-like protein 9 n=1 Tax=Biomphalaria glabrata TaxID=6526 RepID=A0A9W3AWZ7_BIOGL|nr:probable tubulin polyglutamylase TTLL9 isoform X2 [Biomphalaria glabrata]
MCSGQLTRRYHSRSSLLEKYSTLKRRSKRKIQSRLSRISICKQKPTSIRFRCSLQNTILDVLRARPGWVEITTNDWDFCWCDKDWLNNPDECNFFPENSKVSHFLNFFELTRKNLMVKNLKRLRRQLERDSGKLEAQKCDFYPATFELPSEYHIFVDEFRRNPGTIWIMKPIARSQGKGIFLFKRLKDITDWKRGVEYQPQLQVTDASTAPIETYVVQRYIENPYLIGGRKFDIRVYVLVTSYNPLKAYLYRSGFARFANNRYSLDTIDDNYIHLTNVAIQKTAPDYDPEKGCKWSTQQLRMYLTAKHGQSKVNTLFQQMTNIFILSLQSCQRVIINDKHCFELYGYDILIDSNLKPWLIEINASPSLTASNQEDYDLKFGLLNDVLNVLDLENRLTGKEKKVGLFDLMWDDGPVFLEDNGNEDLVKAQTTLTNAKLGCVNDRLQNLKEIYQTAEVFKKLN